jgi:hypothetical protein
MSNVSPLPVLPDDIEPNTDVLPDTENLSEISGEEYFRRNLFSPLKFPNCKDEE